MQRRGVLGMACITSSVSATISAVPLHWISVAHPVTPGIQVHHRLDIEHRNVGISREAAMHFPHRVCVGLIVRLAASALPL